MVGTINMDHRSLVHNFENGVWMHRCGCIADIEKDFADTLETCIRIDETCAKCHFSAAVCPERGKSFCAADVSFLQINISQTFRKHFGKTKGLE